MKRRQWNGRHIDDEIDPIHQRTRDPAAVSRNRFWCAAAFPFHVTPIPARTWVHSRHEHEARGERHGSSRTGNRDTSFFEWLPEYLEHPSVEFGHLIEKQDTVMREADFPWPRNAATTNKRNIRNRMMRGTERAAGQKAGSRTE